MNVLPTIATHAQLDVLIGKLMAENVRPGPIAKWAGRDGTIYIVGTWSNGTKRAVRWVEMSDESEKSSCWTRGLALYGKPNRPWSLNLPIVD